MYLLMYNWQCNS